jgi:2-keto-4-pentenoate hydratase
MPAIRTALAAPAAVLTALAIAGCAATTPPVAEAPGCPSDAQVAELAQRFVAMQPVPNPPNDMPAAAATCGRDKLARLLSREYGRVVGYKAGLTNPAVQQRFNYPNPVRGTLFERMIVRDGAEVPARFGARPLFEADLVVVVRDSAIHDAKTPMDVLRHLSAVHPFIELPDLVVEDPGKLAGAGIAYINVGARLGVLGAAIPVRAEQAFSDALRDMTVRLTDASGKELDSGRGSAILGHPLNAVVWLAEDLRRSGITLRPGDLLSLGSFTRLLPPQPGMAVRASYEGLPGNPSVSVRFR